MYVFVLETARQFYELYMKGIGSRMRCEHGIQYHIFSEANNWENTTKYTKNVFDYMTLTDFEKATMESVKTKNFGMA